MQCSSVSTGIMGLVANKGAVAIRFKCLDSYFCIVNSHLAADQNNTDRRNQDFADQVSRLYFPDAFNISSVPWVPRLSETQYKVIITGSGSPGNLSVFDCDFLFWLGILN